MLEFVWAATFSESLFTLLEGTHNRNMACWVLLGGAAMVSVRNGVPGKAPVRCEAKGLLGLSLSLSFAFLFVLSPPKPSTSLYPKQILHTSCIVSASLGFAHFGFWSLEAQVPSVNTHSLPSRSGHSHLVSETSDCAFAASQGTVFCFVNFVGFLRFYICFMNCDYVSCSIIHL